MSRDMKNSRPADDSTLAGLVSGVPTGLGETPADTPKAVSSARSASPDVPVGGSPLVPLRQRGLIEHLDGTYTLDITIPPEQASMLRSWAEQAGEPLEDYTRRMVLESLLAVASSEAG